MFKKIALSMVLTLVSATAVLAANYIEPQELKELLGKKQAVILVDIQPAADFEKQHLPASIETNAFPAAKKDCHPLPPAELKKLFARHGVDTSKPVVYYCLRPATTRGGAGRRGRSGQDSR